MASSLDDLISAFRCTFFPVQVLVVDDDVIVRASIRRILERQGYSVIVAEDGVDALRLLERTHVPVDLLVTDIQMPGISGDQLALKVRDAWPDLPVLFVSGQQHNANLVGQLGGRATFLLKPFLPGELVAAVEAVLEPPAEPDLLFEPLARLS
jgi:DNA-binding response OmpR family regulator